MPAKRVRSGEGAMFGTNLTVEIEVKSPATETPSPTSAPSAPPTAIAPEPTTVPINPPPSTSPYTGRVTEEATLPGGGEGSVTANCPAGGVAVGGGYSGSPGVVFIVNRRSGNGWQVYAVNTNPSAKTIRAYAVCLRNMVGTSVSVEHRQITVKGHGSKSGDVPCPAGSIITAGGWETEYVDVRVDTSTEGGQDWDVSAHNKSDTDHPLHIHAVCLSGSGGITSEFGREVEIAGGDAGEASITCPLGSLMTGGGFVAAKFEVFVNSGPWVAAPDAEWRGYGENTASFPVPLEVTVLCLGFP